MSRHVVSGFVTAIVTSLLVLPFLLATSTAAVFYVDAARPDDSGDGTSWGTAKKTVQAGINAAAPGDTILVAYGLYTILDACTLTTDRKITSDNGTHDSWDTAEPDSNQCVLEADTSRVLTIKGSAVTSATEIRGFKITGGNATNEDDPDNAYGGGVYIAEGADATIENCWITNNTAGMEWNGYGGGIACRDEGTDVVIRYCNIDSNTATTVWIGLGGGVYFGASASGEVYANTISYNTASTNRIGEGGGISCQNADVNIWSNTISYNIASSTSAVGGSGGGILVFSGNVEIWDNIITYNTAAQGNNQRGEGGGISCENGGSNVHDNPEISHNVASSGGPGYGGGIYCVATNVSGNVITHNTASTSNAVSPYYRTGRGGGIHTSGSGTTVTDNVISDNVGSVYGEGWGGGICFDTGPTIERDIISFNIASSTYIGYGGGTWSYNASFAEIINNTFYRNANTDQGTGLGYGSGICHESGGTPTVANNIIMNHDVEDSDSLGVYSGVAITITNNCFHNNPGGDYNANVTSLNEPGTDPRLTDPDNGDFTLMYDSPCIEEGDPAYPCPENGGWIVDIGAKEYTGTRHKRTIPGAGEYLFGGQVRAKVNLTTLGSVTDIDMTVHPGELHPVASTGVMRWHEISATGGGATFDLTLSYNEDELLLVDETDLYVWRWTGSWWDGPKTPSAASLSENWITVSGQTAFSGWQITGVWGPTAARDAQVIPVRYELSVNYPNPFNPVTNIEYSLKHDSHVRLAIYDAAGRLVRVLEDGTQPAGYYRTFWDALNQSSTPVTSGVYFLKLSAGDFLQVRKLVLVR